MPKWVHLVTFTTHPHVNLRAFLGMFNTKHLGTAYLGFPPGRDLKIQFTFFKCFSQEPNIAMFKRQCIGLKYPAVSLILRRYAHHFDALLCDP